MSDFISQFLDAMKAGGFEPKGKFMADDKWHPAYYMDETGHTCSGTYSMKIVSDEFAIGCFFTRKDPDTKHKWHSKSGEKLDPAERKKINAQIKEQQRQKEIEEETRQRKISRRLTAYYKALPKLNDVKHDYLSRKDVGHHNIKLRKKGNELIIPLYGSDGNIWTIQRITPKGGKYLFAGGRKQGSYFPMCTSKEDLSIILICEGFATGASVRQATRYPVIVAIDSGNLKPVLVALKAKYPKTKFIICADNDAFTKNAKGESWNVGVDKASQAAEAVGGAYVVFPAIVNEKNTDFNDLHAASGLDIVKEQIEKVIKGIPEREEVAASDESHQLSNQHTGGDDFIPDHAPIDYDDRDYEAEAANIDPLEGDFGMNYKVLGYNKGTYYYFPFKERQIVALSASAHTLPNLFRLDNLDNWMTQFGSTETSEKKVVMYATNALMKLAKHRGVFKEEDRVRGCGAWIDQGRKILHCGDVLYVDGVATKFDQLESEFTYVAASKLLRPADEPLSNKEANALRHICELVTWENKLSGSLLAGWMVIAPICGALPFRPHVYITGEAESGKSTVLNKIRLES